MKEKVRSFLKKIVNPVDNQSMRDAWVEKTLREIPQGLRLLDAGAGEQRYKKYCEHLEYISQDFSEYNGVGNQSGLQTGKWDVSGIHIVSDIAHIPEPDCSFDVILCTEVLEHIPDPLKALDEFERLCKPGGLLILTAPFSSLVHFAPYHYATGFSRYWYEYHLPARGFDIIELAPNGDWFSYLQQELLRLPSMAKRYGYLFRPLAYLVAGIGVIYILLCGKKARAATDIACFGWHCLARKK